MQGGVGIGVRPFEGQVHHDQVQQNDSAGNESVSDHRMAVVPLSDRAQQALRIGLEPQVVVCGHVGGWTAGLRGWQLTGHRGQCVIPRGRDRRRLVRL